MRLWPAQSFKSRLVINSDKEGYISIPFLTERSARSHRSHLISETLPRLCQDAGAECAEIDYVTIFL